MRKRPPPDEQASLFDQAAPRVAKKEALRPKTPAKADTARRNWQMPAREGRTVAEIRLRWPKRLTPAQVTRVEAELSRLPAILTKLGFGAVQVERTFVRRRRT